MARPTKQGIDYFPLDCQFDDKVEMYLIEKGAVGLSVLITLWQMIYSNKGYYITDDEDLKLLIKRKIDVDINEITDCINLCLRRNIFNQEMHEKHTILTSKAIQRRYFDAAKKKKAVQVFNDYVINGIDSCDNWVFTNGNATNVNVKEEVKEKVKEQRELIPEEIKKTKQVKSPVSIKTYLANCDQQKTQPMPETDPVFEYAQSIKLPNEFLYLAWIEFVDRYIENGKKQKDWKATFRNCIRGNWLKLWFINNDNEYQLSTQGMQAKKKQEAAA